ncbi:MAG: hypothetical protein ACOZNI_09990 [Myxococcota bacterium]
MLLLFAACSGVVKVDDTGSTAADDTGDTDTTTILDDTGDGDSGDTATTPLPEGDLTFAFDRDVAGQTLVLTQLAFDFATFGDVLVEAEIEGDTLTVTAAPPNGALDELPDNPGAVGALYVPGVVDDDGVFTGVGLHWPLYLAEVSPELESYGLVVGWNVLVVETDTPTVGDPEDVEVSAWLDLVPSVTIGGTWGGDPAYEEVGLGLAPTSDGARTFMLDERIATDEPWSLTVAEEPPGDHVDDEGGVGVAYEIPFAYDDADGVEGISSGDTVLGYACLDTAIAVLLWATPPETIEGAWALASAGASPGWNAYAIVPDVSMEPIDADTPLTLASGCGF